MAPQTEADVIYAAGGIVVCQSRQGQTIAVIHRPRYGDWSLPKGKVQQGESWQVAALREVGEEIACQARVTTFAGVTSHLVNGVPKIVAFWNMVAEGECTFKPSEEVDQVLWLPPPRALRKLQYPEDREIVARVFPAKRRSLRTWLRNIHIRTWLRNIHIAPEYRRLSGDLQTYSIELDRLITLNHQKTPQGDLSWATHAQGLLIQAQVNLENGHLDEAWKCFDAARRLELMGLDCDELISQAESLQEEMQKLSKWRRKAVKKLLSDFDKINDRHKMSARLYQAAWLRDDDANTNYYRITLLRQQLKILSSILGLALLAVLALSFTYPLNALLVAGDWRNLVMVGLFGILGASFSAILSVAGTSVQSRIPEQVVNSTITAMRPLLGAASALAAYVFLQAGIINVQAVTWGGILAIAFASGFSERLVVRAVETVSGQSSSTPTDEDDKGK